MNIKSTMQNITLLSVILILINLQLSSCKTPKEQRLDTITSILSDSIETTTSIQIIDESYDSIYSTQRNISNLNKIQDIIQLRKSILQRLEAFKTKYADENNRVWLRNISNELRESLDEIKNNTSQMCSLIDDLGEKCNSDTLIGRPQQSVVIKYNANNKTRYGLFIFSNDTKVSQYKIFSEEEYNSIEDFITTATTDVRVFIPSFESIGIDIVPADEDPSKNKEERKQIREEQEAKRQAEYYAYMKKTNPLPKKFYGATLGKSHISVILQRLEKEGWQVFPPSNLDFALYYCSNWSGYVDGLSYNVIRVHSLDGIFDKIEFIDDYSIRGSTTTIRGNPGRRFFSKEVKDAYRNAKSSAKRNYEFWSKDYDNLKFDDDSITLTVDSDESYYVSYTFAKKHKTSNSDAE